MFSFVKALWLTDSSLKCRSFLMFWVWHKTHDFLTCPYGYHVIQYKEICLLIMLMLPAIFQKSFTARKFDEKAFTTIVPFAYASYHVVSSCTFLPFLPSPNHHDNFTPICEKLILQNLLDSTLFLLKTKVVSQIPHLFSHIPLICKSPESHWTLFSPVEFMLVE